MPIFEYRCDDCGHQFEELISRSDSSVNCEKCESSEITKLFSSFATRVAAGSVNCSTGACAPAVGSCPADSGFG